MHYRESVPKNGHRQEDRLRHSSHSSAVAVGRERCALAAADAIAYGAQRWSANLFGGPALAGDEASRQCGQGPPAEHERFSWHFDASAAISSISPIAAIPAITSAPPSHHRATCRRTCPGVG